MFNKEDLERDAAVENCARLVSRHEFEALSRGFLLLDREHVAGLVPRAFIIATSDFAAADVLSTVIFEDLANGHLRFDAQILLGHLCAAAELTIGERVHLKVEGSRFLGHHLLEELGVIAVELAIV